MILPHMSEIRDINQYDRFTFGDSPELADELLELVLAGKKTATSGPLAIYEIEKSELPQPGQRYVVCNSSGIPKCVIEAVEVKVIAFNKVDSAFAADEGEGDLSLKYWRRAHESFARRHVEFHDDMPFVCERFKIVERL